MSEETVVKDPPASLVSLAIELSVREEELEKLEQDVKDKKAKVAAAEKALVEEMITQQVKSFKTEMHGGFRVQAVVYPNVTNRESLNDFVKKKKLTWLYTMAVNGSKLRAYVRELMQEGKKLPPGIDPFTTTEIRRFK